MFVIPSTNMIDLEHSYPHSKIIALEFSLMLSLNMATMDRMWGANNFRIEEVIHYLYKFVSCS